MITVQPPLLKSYFSPKKEGKGFKSTLFTSFYLSWEDALWHLLLVLKVKHGSKIMVPEFFCGNVTEHMQEHGLKIVYYPVDKKLSTSLSQFTLTLKKEKPGIVIIFHPVGIKNKLIDYYPKWKSSLPEKTILIEDCVHMVLDPEKVKFVSENHYLIDSLRKVVPVQGSSMFSAKPISSVDKLSSGITLPYRVTVMFLWALMQVNLVLANSLKNIKLALIFNYLAEIFMRAGYFLIGKSRLPSPGFKTMESLAKKVNFGKIQSVKKKQAIIYKNLLRKVLKTNVFWIPEMIPSDYKNLRGFPLIVKLKKAEGFLKFMRSKGILLRFELNDSSWSKKQKIVYLPMGIHIKNRDIKKVAGLISKYIQTSYNKTKLNG